VVQTVSGMTARQAEIVPGKTAGPQFYPVSAIDYCTGYLMGVRRHGGAGAPRAGGRKLAGADLACPSRQVDGRSRRGAGGVAQGVPEEFSEAELLSWSTTSETPSGRLPPSPARRADVGNAGALGAAFRSPRLSSSGVAGARRGVSEL